MNESQKYLLDELLGDEGICFEGITPYPMSVGAKVLFLERAINLNAVAFEERLNQLYKPNATPKAEEASLLLIRDLKRIHDLFFNYPVEYHQTKTRPALENTFGGLGAIDVALFQDEIKTRIEAYQKKLADGQIEGVKTERHMCEEVEVHIQAEAGWQSALAALLEDSDNSEEVRRLNRRQLLTMERLVRSRQIDPKA